MEVFVLQGVTGTLVFPKLRDRLIMEIDARSAKYVCLIELIAIPAEAFNKMAYPFIRSGEGFYLSSHTGYDGAVIEACAYL